MKKYMLGALLAAGSMTAMALAYDSTQLTMKPMGPVYKVTVPEGFTPSHWSKGEGINSYSNGWERYQQLNGKGQMPRAHSTVLLSDDNNDSKVAGIPVSEAKKVSKEDLERILRRLE